MPMDIPLKGCHNDSIYISLQGVCWIDYSLFLSNWEGKALHDVTCEDDTVVADAPWFKLAARTSSLSHVCVPGVM